MRHLAKLESSSNKHNTFLERLKSMRIPDIWKMIAKYFCGTKSEETIPTIKLIRRQRRRGGNPTTSYCCKRFLSIAVAVKKSLSERWLHDKKHSTPELRKLYWWRKVSFGTFSLSKTGRVRRFLRSRPLNESWVSELEANCGVSRSKWHFHVRQIQNDSSRSLFGHPFSSQTPANIIIDFYEAKFFWVPHFILYSTVSWFMTLWMFHRSGWT